MTTMTIQKKISAIDLPKKLQGYLKIKTKRRPIKAKNIRFERNIKMENSTQREFSRFEYKEKKLVKKFGVKFVQPVHFVKLVKFVEIIQI